MAGAIEDYILTSELADVEAATRLEEIRAGAVEEDVFGGI